MRENVDRTGRVRWDMPSTPGAEPRTEEGRDVPTARPRPARARWRLFAALAWLGVVGAGGMAGLAWMWPDDLSGGGAAAGALDYLAFMSATFLFHAGVAMAAVLVFALLTRRRRLAAASLVLAAAAAGPELLVAGRARLMESPVTDPAAPTFTLMSANLLYGRADPELFTREVAAHRPDVIVFQEWTPRSAAAVKPLLEAEYPHWVESDRDDAFGQAVCSRRPFSRAARMFPTPGGWNEPQITVSLEFGGREVTITNVHLLPPVNGVYFREQRRGAGRLAEAVPAGDGGSPRIDVLAGDFNAVSRSSVLRAFRGAGLREAHGSAPSAGRLRGTTWPRTGVLRHAPGIRIDHILHGTRLRCVGTAVCNDVGSDHAPIVARFVVASP